MKHAVFFSLIVVLVFTGCRHVDGLACPAGCLHDSIAAKAVAGFDPGQVPRGFWKPRWDSKLKEAKELGDRCQIVFLGDSITHNWEAQGAAVFKETFTQYNTLNLGFSGDATQHTLWIAQESGIFDIVHPKLITLMIGTNNIGWETTPTQTLCGIRQILKALRKNAPQAKILLFAIFPRGEKPVDVYRLLNGVINEQLPAMADGKHIFFVDINVQLMDAEGIVHKSMMDDFLHPEHPGYVIWRDALLPYIDKFVLDN